MDYTRLLIRMSRIVRNPPSRRSLMIMLAAFAVTAVIFGMEWAGLWPDWATGERPRMPRITSP